MIYTVYLFGITKPAKIQHFVDVSYRLSSSHFITIHLHFINLTNDSQLIHMLVRNAMPSLVN